MTKPRFAIIAALFMGAIFASSVVTAALVEVRPKWLAKLATFVIGVRAERGTQFGRATYSPIDFAVRVDGHENWVHARELLLTGRGVPGTIVGSAVGWGGPIEQTHPADPIPKYGRFHPTPPNAPLLYLTGETVDIGRKRYPTNTGIAIYENEIRVLVNGIVVHTFKPQG